MLIWGIGPILITIMGKVGFDPYSQTFYRYATASTFFLAVAAASDWPGLAAAFRAWRRTGAMALTLVVFQLTWVNAVYFTSPTVTGFAGNLSIVFGFAGGAIFFADERAVVLSWRFLVGAAVVMVAAIGAMFGGEVKIEGGPVREGGLAVGAACLVVFPAAWAAYSLLIKRFVGHERRLEARPGGAGHPPGRADASADGLRPRRRAELLRPVPALAVTTAWTTLLVLAVTAAFGDLGHVADVSWKIVLVLVLSGVGCIGVGQMLYYVSIGRIGVAMSQTATRATPLLTGLFSFAILGERMGAFQWACGALLVAGVIFLIKARVAGRRAAAG